jgi:hypothetical protein
MKLEISLQTAAARLKKFSPLRPTLAIVLGSGFHLAEISFQQFTFLARRNFSMMCECQI